MSKIDWYIEGEEYGNCNCNYGCPCQFDSLPTHGHCEAFGIARIKKGHFGDVKLGGLMFGAVYAWPGPVFEGKGQMQAIVDARADASQREAMLKILYGEETDEGANHWWVYHAMSDTVHEPLVKNIQCELDVEARKAKVVIEDLIESEGQPIRSSRTGEEHRVRIDLPNGIEFTYAEIGNASTRSRAAVKLDLRNSYGQFNYVRQTGRGRVLG